MAVRCAIGIDLGTSYARVGVLRNGEVRSLNRTYSQSSNISQYWIFKFLYDNVPSNVACLIQLHSNVKYILSQVEIIPNDQGNKSTPSYVAFTDTHRLVGDPAKNQVVDIIDRE